MPSHQNPMRLDRLSALLQAAAPSVVIGPAEGPPNILLNTLRVRLLVTPGAAAALADCATRGAIGQRPQGNCARVGLYGRVRIVTRAGARTPASICKRTVGPVQRVDAFAH